MKEINFRMWDSKRKMMGYTDMLSIRDHGWPFSFEADSPIMQFTGLCDKNKAPIFEGDICLHENGQRYEVKYGQFVFNIQDEYSCDGFGFHFDDEDLQDWGQVWNPGKVEIVGNIYKNPELLNTSRALQTINNNI